MAKASNGDGSPIEFDHVFSPLAYHFFPDGSDWLDRNVNRAPVPPRTAMQALRQLQIQGIGLTERQLWALTMVACASLDNDNSLKSPLIDGTSKNFCSLIKCALPRDSVPLNVIDCLLGRLASLDKTGKACVLRFFTLVVTNRKANLDEPRRRALLSTVLSLTMQCCSQEPTLCQDGVRLLLLFHGDSVTVKRIQLCLRRHSLTKHPLSTLLEYYTIGDSLDLPLWCDFPDPKWQAEFGTSQVQPSTFTALRVQLVPYQEAHSLALQVARILDAKQKQEEQQHQQQLDTCSLPFVLKEVWYPQSSTRSETSLAQERTKLLTTLLSWAEQTDELPEPAKDFCVKHILPVWDGSTGPTLDLMPYLAAKPVLKHVERVFLYASPTTKYEIVSASLSKMIARGPTQKSKTLRKVIQFTDELLVRAMLVEAHELVQTAAIDFYETVASVATTREMFLPAPSPNLCYRLLLASTALQVDRTCQLLVDYLPVYKRLKESNTDMDRVKVFNCLVWDFCSVLWRGASFDDANLSILFTNLTTETRERIHHETMSWSIMNSIVFAQHRRNFQRDRQVSSSDMTRSKVKLEYLDYLHEECGLKGLYNFLSTFVGSLANRARKKNAAPT
jgi:hypothetical protein